MYARHSLQIMTANVSASHIKGAGICTLGSSRCPRERDERHRQGSDPLHRPWYSAKTQLQAA